MVKVEIYTKFLCPYCTRAKSLLASKGVEMVEYDISLGGPKRVEMIQRSNGRATFPQIFIGDQHVGGCDDMMALEYDGKLDALLAA